MTRECSPPGVRLAEVLAALSLVTDLARGHPPEEAMRACLLAVHLGRRLGLHESDLFDAYYATLLRFVGCTATSTAYAAGFAGDDVDVRRAGDLMDPTVPGEALGFLWTLSRRTSATRPLQFARMLSHAPTLAREAPRRTARLARDLSRVSASRLRSRRRCCTPSNAGTDEKFGRQASLRQHFAVGRTSTRQTCLGARPPDFMATNVFGRAPRRRR